jgi:acetyltransferase-like isoleucine patch superfamily enzyme
MSNRKIASSVVLGQNVYLADFINLYGCRIGDNAKIGPFVEIQKNVTVGRNCKIQSHSFLCEGVSIEDEAFIGHGVMFINDRYPRSATADGSLQTEADWKVVPTVIKKGASIGSNATILCGVTVGEGAIVGAGSVVTRDIPPHAIAAGNPARVIRKID